MVLPIGGMMNKHIEEFEAFMADRFGDLIDRRRCLNGDGDDYMSWDMQVAKIVWMHFTDKLEAAEKGNAFLKEQLSQLANFNPDWDKLEACQESWRELASFQKETLQRAEAAEARLLVPVKLWSLKNWREAPAGGIEWAKGYMVARNADVAAIKEAGYPVEGSE